MTRTCIGYEARGVRHECTATFEVKRGSPTVRCRECQYERDLETRRVSWRRKHLGLAAPCARKLVRGPVFDAPKRKEPKCHTCGSMPWRVAGAQCEECGMHYAEEPPPEQGAALRSSMALSVRHGELHGLTPGHYTPGIKAIGDKAHRRK